MVMVDVAGVDASRLQGVSSNWELSAFEPRA